MQWLAELHEWIKYGVLIVDYYYYLQITTRFLTFLCLK